MLGTHLPVGYTSKGCWPYPGYAMRGARGYTSKGRGPYIHPFGKGPGIHLQRLCAVPRGVLRAMVWVHPWTSFPGDPGVPPHTQYSIHLHLHLTPCTLWGYTSKGCWPYHEGCWWIHLWTSFPGLGMLQEVPWGYTSKGCGPYLGYAREGT